MIFIFGRYNRTATLPPSTGPCPACRQTATIYWRRTYKTGHFFFFPLFSFAEKHQAACGACGYQMEGRYPGPPPPLPFIDRLGFLVPLGVGGVAVIGFIALIAIGIATAPPPKVPTAAQAAATSEKAALELHLHTGAAYGDSEVEKTLASKVFTSMQKDEGLPARDVGVAVRVKPGAVKRVIVLVEVTTLKDLRPKARRDLVDDVRKSMADDLESEDIVTVAVKGTLFYGALSTGPEGEAVDVEIDSLIPTEKVEAAFSASTLNAGHD